jgi:hypothetical protein
VGEAELSHGGLLKLGDYVMPEAAARVVNNYLSPGLNPHLWYRTLRQTSNLLNGVQLGLSAFHLGFTSLDAATSRLAIGLEDLARGKPLSALSSVASVPFSPVTNIRTGAKLRAEILQPGTHPEMAALARAAEQAGGNLLEQGFAGHRRVDPHQVGMRLRLVHRDGHWHHSSRHQDLQQQAGRCSEARLGQLQRR